MCVSLPFIKSVVKPKPIILSCSSLSSCFCIHAAEEEHKTTWDPFKACEKLGSQGPGAEETRSGALPTGTVAVSYTFFLSNH